MDRGAWWAAVHGVAKSWTQLSDFTFSLGRGNPRGRGGAASSESRPRCWGGRQPGVNWVLLLVPRGHPPPAPCPGHAMPGSLQHWRCSQPLFCPSSGFCVDHPQRISVHQSSINPAAWGPPVLASAPSLLRHCPVRGLFVAPQHPLCLRSGPSSQVFVTSPWAHPTSFSL